MEIILIYLISLPALEEPSCFSIGQHLAALNSARKAFVAAESSEKIKRALKRQTRPSGEVCQIGDEVSLCEMILHGGKDLHEFWAKMD